MNRKRCVLAAAGMLAAALVSACGGSKSPASPQVRIPNYAGNWSGTYTVTGCNQSGAAALANICGTLGSTPPYGFTLTQSDRNVAGSFTLGSIVFPNTGGAIAQDGSLPLSGTTVASGITIVVNWALNMPAQAITGTITQQWTSVASPGSATVTGSINSAIRSSTANAVALSKPGIRATLADLAAAMSQK
jgi:hypothetical protein